VLRASDRVAGGMGWLRAQPDVDGVRTREVEMVEIPQYADKYRFSKLERTDGILRIGLHTDGGPFQWNLDAQRELVGVFTDVAADRANRLIILTGTGDEFSGPYQSTDRTVYNQGGVSITSEGLDRVHWNAKRLMTRLLDIEVPIIGVLNGPAKRHCELVLMSDIVIAADDATFEDTAHFELGSQVPGDGMAVVLTQLLGLNRARFMMLTGQVITAQQALEWGVVNEVMPRERLEARAWELARQLARKPDLLLRYTRIVLTQPLRDGMIENLQYHLALETLSSLQSHAHEQVDGNARGS
jgi:enoyl-CoA hydratase/carnithine racemase